MLEHIWVRETKPGDGTFYVVSGFSNFNGSVRFLKTFKRHTDAGGRIVSVLAGSPRQCLSSRQVVSALLESGSEVYIVNRKRLLHAKFYGACTSKGQDLVVSSGNFTGPGMGLNVESSLWLDPAAAQAAGFDWDDVIRA